MELPCMVHLSLRASSKENYTMCGVIFLAACLQRQIFHAWNFHAKVPMNTYLKGMYSLEFLRGTWLFCTMLGCNLPCCLPGRTTVNKAHKCDAAGNKVSSQRAFVPSRVSHFEIRKMSNCCHIPSLLSSSM